MSEAGGLRTTLFRLIPLLMVVAFVGWCSSGTRRSGPEQQQLRAELSDLFLTQGLVSGPTPDLAKAAKQAGPAEMTRALYESAPTASLPVLEWLVQHGADPKNVVESRDMPLLHKLAQRPQYDRIDYVLGLGLDPQRRNRAGQNMLHIAAEAGLDERVLGLLTAKGLSVSDRTSSGQQPLHTAAVKSIPVLLKAGADINATDEDQRTPLHVAALGGRHEVVAELLRHGASVHAIDKRGRTPLHLAALNINQYEADATIDVLLSFGAQRAARDLDNLTPRELAEATRKNARTIRRQDPLQKL